MEDNDEKNLNGRQPKKITMEDNQKKENETQPKFYIFILLYKTDKWKSSIQFNFQKFFKPNFQLFVI